MITKIILIIMLCLFIFDGFIWIAMLGNISRIYDILKKMEEKE